MKVKPVLAAVILVLVSFGAIAFLRNAQFQEEKRQASMAIAKDKAACQLKSITENEALFREGLAERNPDYKAYYEEQKKKVVEANKACERLDEYIAKYGSP